MDKCTKVVAALVKLEDVVGKIAHQEQRAAEACRDLGEALLAEANRGAYAPFERPPALVLAEADVALLLGRRAGARSSEAFNRQEYWRRRSELLDSLNGGVEVDPHVFTRAVHALSLSFERMREVDVAPMGYWLRSSWGAREYWLGRETFAQNETLVYREVEEETPPPTLHLDPDGATVRLGGQVVGKLARQRQ